MGLGDQVVRQQVVLGEIQNLLEDVLVAQLEIYAIDHSLLGGQGGRYLTVDENSQFLGNGVLE